MGKDISKLDFSAEDFHLFRYKLDQQLEQLKSLLARPDFGQGPLCLGAELELYLVDDNAEVSLSNQLLLDDLKDPQFQTELNRYNLELNLSAVPVAGRPFSRLRAEILEKTSYLERVAARRNINIVPVGILPTLRAEHLEARYMTDIPRYQCLARHLYQQRGEPFQVNINGEQPISASFDNICAEGANTSFQVHLMTAPEQFVRIFNAAQLTMPLVTAIAANSGIFLGNRVWDETRISLFKQSLDIRCHDAFARRLPTRVNFGLGWLRHSVWEAFAEAVAVYPPLIPQLFDEKGTRDIPALEELCLHMGTIWPWLRPVYSNQGGGHVRLEFRALPAGPTSIDMVANAALAIGLATGLADDIDELLAVMPFDVAEYNFYRAAQLGIDAKIQWPLNHKYHPADVEIVDVLQAMLPRAKQGLAQLGVLAEEIDYFISIIEQRLQQRLTGAVWQKQTLKAYERDMDKRSACRKLVQLYIQNCRSCQPVACWERPWQ